MSITTARVAQVTVGKKDATVVYVKSASGNVYRFKQAVSLEKVARFVDRVRKTGVINLHAWKKVRDGGYTKARTTHHKDGSVKIQSRYGTVYVQPGTGLLTTRLTSIDNLHKAYEEAYCELSELTTEQSQIRGVKDPEHEAAIELAAKKFRRAEEALNARTAEGAA